MSVVGIVPAGGSGERLGADRPKAFVVLAGRPLLEWSLAALRAVCERVVVAVPPGHERLPDRVTGGDSRSASVRNALAAAPEATVAVVHDAARPLVTAELIERCIAALEPGVDGAIAAARMTDTVKEAAADGRVTADARPALAVGDPDAAGVPRRRAAAGARRRRGGARRRHRRRGARGGRWAARCAWSRRRSRTSRSRGVHDLRVAEALLC